MRVLKLLLIVLLFINCLPYVHAQEKRYLTGHVYDEFEKPMDKVTIFSESGYYLFTTDSTGYFKIEAQRGIQLTFSGYNKADRIVKIKKRNNNRIYFYGAKKLIALRRKEENKTAKAEKKQARKYNKMARSSESLSAITGHEKLGNPYMHKVIGKVVDNQGLPLPGVLILLNGTKRYVTTDLDGFYGIDANVGDVLVFSCMGYDTVAFRITDSIINIRMEEYIREL